MPHITAIILAAGRSSRMGASNKLLLPFGEWTILEHVVANVSRSSVDDLVVVTGHEDRQIRDVLSDPRVRVAYNPEHEKGMATSLRRGLLAAAPDTDGFMICLGDMPLVTIETLTKLCEAFAAQDGRAIVVPTVGGERGHPVLFHRAFREALMQLEGDVGARAVLAAHEADVVEVPVQDEGIFHDIDTQEAYDRARGADVAKRV